MGSGSWTVIMQIDHFIIQSTRRNIVYDYVNLLIFRQSMNWKFSHHTARFTSGHKIEDDHSLVKHLSESSHNMFQSRKHKQNYESEKN